MATQLHDLSRWFVFQSSLLLFQFSRRSMDDCITDVPMLISNDLLICSSVCVHDCLFKRLGAKYVSSTVSFYVSFLLLLILFLSGSSFPSCTTFSPVFRIQLLLGYTVIPVSLNSFCKFIIESTIVDEAFKIVRIFLYLCTHSMDWDKFLDLQANFEVKNSHMKGKNYVPAEDSCMVILCV